MSRELAERDQFVVDSALLAERNRAPQLVESSVIFSNHTAVQLALSSTQSKLVPKSKESVNDFQTHAFSNKKTNLLAKR